MVKSLHAPGSLLEHHAPGRQSPRAPNPTRSARLSVSARKQPTSNYADADHKTG